MNEKKWYAVYTRARWEKKVSEILTKQQIENYCPLNKFQRQWADRKKIVTEPLFTSYVFVRGTEHDHLKIRKTEGVINLIYWLGKPAVIRDYEIKIIQEFMNEHSNVSIEKTPVNVNDKVRIISGPLVNREGNVIAVKSNTVKIVLPSLGFTMSAEVETAKVILIRDKMVHYDQDSSIIAL